MRVELERDVQKGILDYLKMMGFVAVKHRNVGIYKKKTDIYIPLPVDERGISDIIACDRHGRFWAIEVKRSDGVPSEEQLAFIESVKHNGGISFIAYSIDDVIREVKAHRVA